jgi:hypothetical protein
MKNIILIILTISLFNSCSKEENDDYMKAAIIDVVNNQKVNSSSLIRGYGSKSLKDFTYQEDTFTVNHGESISKLDFFVDLNKNCIGEVFLENENYHPLWIYNHFCQDYLDENNSILFEAKPYVNLKLNLSFDEAVPFLEIRTLDSPIEYGVIKRSRQLIDRNRIACSNGNTITDTILNLSVIQNDTIDLIIRYGRNTNYTEYKNIVETDMSNDYELTIEF